MPMRPGCFCTLVTSEDLAQTMTRMGFSTLKDSVLNAGINLKESAGTPSDVLDESSEGQSITETVKSLRKAVLDQAADPDTLFTVQGAKDFTKRTGVKNKLCAGIKPTAEDTNVGVTDPTGDTPVPKPEQMEDTMAVTQTQIDNLTKYFCSSSSSSFCLSNRLCLSSNNISSRKHNYKLYRVSCSWPPYFNILSNLKPNICGILSNSRPGKGFSGGRLSTTRAVYQILATNRFSTGL